jgi:hypothetical protein
MRIIEGDFAKGFFFGIAIVIPLWAAVVGWTEIMYHHEFSHDIITIIHRMHH